MADFLLELLSEEIPARMQAKASADLARLFEERIAETGLKAEAVETYATPRRLALIARGLPERTEAVSEEVKGPRTSAPPQALEGFLRKTGLGQDRLVERDGIWFATIETPGRDAAEVLAEAVPAIVRAFPWPKSMRWGESSASTESLRWVRPLQGIVALLGDRLVEFEIGGIRSGAATVGHRFHHPGAITIGSAGDYVEKLRACHVILDPAERRQIIADGAARAAADAGLGLIEDEGLVAENAGLTEWPVPLLGSFDPAFLEVPREVIQLTMRTNQKYFALAGKDGALAPNFVCVANIEASDGGAAIVEGNRKVLAARLADAKFFWAQDLKVPLAEQAKKLGGIVFHEKLGTVADKAERVAKLAEWLVSERIVRADFEAVGTAARLAKADLVTQSVGEFPELQGTLGSYLARAQGQSDAVADAIRDHYKPAGQGDDVPTDKVTIAVNIADKIDTLVSFFSIGEKPTGSRDPFALRRAALGFLQILTRNGLRIPLGDVLTQAAVLVIVSRLGALSSVTFPDLLDSDDHEHEITAEVGSFTYRHGDHVVVRWKAEQTPNIERGRIIEEVQDLAEAILDFLEDRLKVQQREAGVRHDLIDAVFACRNEKGCGEDDLVRLLARVKALQGFVESAQGTDLLAGYKRAANILKRENWPPLPGREGPGVGSAEGAPAIESAGSPRSPPTPSPSLSGRGMEERVFSYTPQLEESELDDALDAAEPKVKAAVEAEEYERAMSALASLRAPVDAFFDKVTVNDPDPAKREVRLDLLARVRDAVHRVADFSRIEG
jgi:glycyl-tRNA synthetase beta chain